MASEPEIVAAPEGDAAAAAARIEELERTVNTQKHLIAQLEAEIQTLSEVKQPPAAAHKSKHKTKKRRKKKKGHKDQPAEEDDAHHPPGAEITHEMLLELYPDIKLETVVIAEQQFSEADKDGNGVIDMQELEAFLEAHEHYAGPETLRNILQELDADGDDSIDLLEYTGACYLMADPKRMAAKRKGMDAKTSSAFATLQNSYARASKTCTVQ